MDLVQLYLLITQVDTTSIVEHLIEMGVAQHRIDRRTLQQEVRRLIRKYQPVGTNWGFSSICLIYLKPPCCWIALPTGWP